MSITNMHPPIIGASAIRDDNVDGGYLINFAGIIAIAKEGETPKSRLLYSTYCQEYRALEGKGLDHKPREEWALRAAMAKMGWILVNDPSGGKPA